VAATVGRPAADLYRDGLSRHVHEDDVAMLEQVRTSGSPAEFTMRLRNASGDWRQLEVRAIDLRSDRRLRGVVLHGRDVTDRLVLEDQLTTQLRRDGFSNHLAEALEMADEEREVFDVVELAMSEISERTPMELLLSDSSRANLGRSAAAPGAEPPGCPVKSPFSCVAVRRGTAVVFESSSALNACPHLRDRPGGDCSAVCVPVSFMGRALGVLHTTGPDGKPLQEEAKFRLNTLASQAGARIGTVRAFEKTQLQASTDGLTGLINRRSAERRLRELIRSGHMFSLAIADLDRFKQLNDTHGHEAGDRALRLFAQTLKDTLRDHDVIARWGGEEFVIVLPELDRLQAVHVLDRARANLAVAHPGETPRFTASFGLSDSSQATGIEDLLRIADGGLYAAKKAGRDRVVIGDADKAAAAEVEHERDYDVGDDEDSTEGRAPDPDDPGLPARNGASAMHIAAEEEDPAPNGVQIR
jgi:diguanylate cyclase (GGDEF)-like protein